MDADDAHMSESSEDREANSTIFAPSQFPAWYAHPLDIRGESRRDHYFGTPDEIEGPKTVRPEILRRSRVLLYTPAGRTSNDEAVVGDS